MNNENFSVIINKFKSIVLQIDHNAVLKDANSAGIAVGAISDFKNHSHNYWRIEDIMNTYAGLAARYSALSGATAGVGGAVTLVTLGGVDLANMAAQLYRLGQRLAILNGFDPSDAIQKERINEIYLCALGFDGVAQAAIKQQLLRAANIAGKRGAYSNPVLKLIVIVASKLGKDITSKKAASYIPVVGFFIGATVNYVFARTAAKTMVKLYKEEYFRTWQARQGQRSN